MPVATTAGGADDPAMCACRMFHFWEKMQPGMDALGFISLTGTNMILRCRALQDCGWFPTESVTEDWELGMRMVRSLRCCASGAALACEFRR